MTDKQLSSEHKQALAEGRAASRAVRGYLEALESHRPRRGRKRTPESIRRRLDAIERELAADVDPLARLHLIQERMDLGEEVAQLNDGVDLGSLEAEFVEVAASYSARKGISYTAWRELGVSADVLKRAGVGRRSNNA
ncbi:MAG: hypothetical protein GEV08_16725 [Acidimicrobiia bacterium]|nr:hypothetical protein [Acidimicrobiia bacterium]